MAEFKTMRGAFAEAIQHVVAEHESGFVTKFVLVVESVEEDGSSGVWAMAGEGQKPWDTLGLLEYAHKLEDAAVIAGQLGL